MPVETEAKPQDIFEVWSVTKEELSQAILENGSLRGMVFGYVAEIKIDLLHKSSWNEFQGCKVRLSACADIR